MKRVIIDKQANLEYYGTKTKVPMILLSILGILKRKHDKKFDDVILITGEVGSAKSTMSQLIGGIWQLLHGKKLGLEHFTWQSQGIVDFIDAEGNDNEVIIYDEAITGGTGRASLTKEGNMLKIGLVVGRRKRHLYIFIVDEVLEFSKKIISRSSLLIDMRTLMVRGEKARGYFKIYNEKEIKEMYWMLKDQRIRYISQYNATSKPFYKFRDVTNHFISEEEYENEKIRQTKQQQEVQGKKTINENEAKVIALKLKNKGITQEQIAEKVGISRSYVADIISKMSAAVVE